MNQNIYIDTFTREAANYVQKLSYVDFDISINQSKYTLMQLNLRTQSYSL